MTVLATDGVQTGLDQDAAGLPGAPGPSGLPCLNSNNSNGSSLTGGHKRTAYALAENVKLLAAKFGIDRLGFLTLTFRDHVVCIKEAQRRFNSLRTGVLANHYAASIAVVERQKSGRIHFHLIVVLAGDIRTGFDFLAIANQDYRSANAALREEWSFWRRTAHKYGFGRTELLPIKSTAEGIAKYAGKYIAKHMEARDPRDKGARLVRYTADARQVGTRFAWVGIKPWLFRAKLAQVAEEFHCQDLDDMREAFGPKWAYNLSGYIMSSRLPEGSYPSLEHLAADLRWFSERGYFTDTSSIYVQHRTTENHVGLVRSASADGSANPRDAGENASSEEPGHGSHSVRGERYSGGGHRADEVELLPQSGRGLESVIARSLRG